ncbi:hypothetical protein [Salipiger mucosus]|uniref:hypothetical protein n=1 Tax=Salipiger mucosus TaxID=263378 RepID=UPI0003702E0D|nr:hypothetical protein [Salipiger mucosus]
MRHIYDHTRQQREAARAMILRAAVTRMLGALRRARQARHARVGRALPPKDRAHPTPRKAL